MKRARTQMICYALASAAVLAACEDEAAEPEGAKPDEASPQVQPMHPGGGMMGQLAAGCPMAIAGTDVEVSDTDDGVALTFTTADGDADAVRARVDHMAQMYEMHRGQRGMMWHHMGGGRGGGGMGMGPGAGRGPMPAADATVSEIERGARLELRPTEPSQLDALREHVRLHQQRMAGGECWMLQGQGAE